MVRSCVLTLFAAAACWAQIGLPGQYPGGPGPYPGGYPPGGYPGRGPGVPMPGGRHKKKQDTEPLKQDNGKIMEIAADHLLIETNDHRNVTYTITKETKFLDEDKPLKLEDMAVGQGVMVESREGDKEDFTAVNVHLVTKLPSTVVTEAPKDTGRDDGDNGPPKIRRTPEKAAEASPPPAENAPADTPSTIVEKAPVNAPAEADDGSRPVLRRGKPRETAASAPPPPVQVASARKPVAADSADDTAEPMRPPKASSGNDFLDKAREVAEQFTEGLPNFTCSEMVTRYLTEEVHGVNWKPIDVVTTKLLYEDGKESYRDTTVGGKKADPEKSGSWSYGEFGTVLAELFHLDAHFTFAHDSDMNGFTAKKFNMEVDRPHSDWTIHEGGQMIRPAFKGSVWIDKATYRVVRIEQQAVDIPKAFPLDTVEMALDYQFVSLGTKKFLVPVHAEVLACHRGTSQCDKNAIDFRNYKKFGSESDITFGQ